MSTPTTGSLNIAILDSNIVADLCAGVFYVDATPSVYIGAGAGTSGGVLGASVQITNPYGVIVKDYPTSGYDIYPPMTDVIPVSIPTMAGNYQYGKYTVTVLLTDADGTTYSISKIISVCVPNPLDKTKKFGTLSAQLNGVCKDGKVWVIADQVPTYNGAISDTQVNAFTLEYPTSSGLAVISTTVGSFSTQLFEGVYKFTGTICANYTVADNVAYKVSYHVKREKNIRCLLDECCIAAKLSQLDAQIKSDCTDAEKLDTQNIIIGTLRLVKTIEIMITCGLDAGDLIDELETLLGCTCTCNCADGTPVINTMPARDVTITGCNVEKTTVGLTDSYVIDNYAYTVAVAPNGGALIITTPTLLDCTKTQTLTFSIAAVYAQIKNQINNSGEYDFWASIVNNSLDDVDIACLDITQEQWDLGTFAFRLKAIIDQSCLGGNCDAVISAASKVVTANDVTISWTNGSDVYEVAAYLDGLLQGIVLVGAAPTSSYTFVGAADGVSYDWTIVAKCSNGAVGNSLNGSFIEVGCPTIATPNLSAASVSGACPYDLTSLIVGIPPAGIEDEWHTLNNTLVSSLVPDPTSVGAPGNYYVFNKDADGCYSSPVKVTLTCTGDTACTEPQNVDVEVVGNDFRVKFNPAAYPPDDYTVKRTLLANKDDGGSYVLVGSGTPQYTLGIGWWIMDTVAVDNVLYNYRVYSNCADSAPFADHTFVNITCPVDLTVTPYCDSLDYSFTGVAGEVDKYIVTIYDVSGVEQDHDTHNAAFSTPITGTLLYLDAHTSYNVVITVFIGAYSKVCPAYNTATVCNFTETAAYNLSIASVTGTGVPSLGATGTNGALYGSLTGAMSGTYAVEITGTVPVSPAIKLVATVNGVEVDCIAVLAAGSYSLTIAALITDTVIIGISSGTC